MELSVLIKSVEDAIRKMGLAEDESKADENGQWILLKNEMPVYIDVWQDSESTPWNYFVFKEDASVFSDYHTVYVCAHIKAKRILARIIDCKFEFNVWGVFL